MSEMKEISALDIGGILIGHEQNNDAGTGCTVVICPNGAVAGVDVRGGAPATRETDLLDPVNMVDKIHAVVLSGGSAFGLDAASGVMKFLEERDVGFDVAVAKVPIVCGASLFDLTVGSASVRPDAAMGYRACENAWKNAPLEQGCVGVGTGASVGKLRGMERAMKSGFGFYGLQIGSLKVASIVAPNALGDIVNPSTGEALAGLLDEDHKKILNTEDEMCVDYTNAENLFNKSHENTTIGVVITNGKMTKAQAKKVAGMAHNGFARALRPAHTMFDGDTIFALSAPDSNDVSADVNVIGILAARTMSRAIRNAALFARATHGLPSHSSHSLI
ncbi:peptidase [Synergistales bacterium]|nr:peptidase [Synergistales bacterium]